MRPIILCSTVWLAAVVLFGPVGAVSQKRKPFHHIHPDKQSERLDRLRKRGEQLRNSELHPASKKRAIFARHRDQFAPTTAHEEAVDRLPENWSSSSKSVLSPLLTGKYDLKYDAQNTTSAEPVSMTPAEAAAEEDCHVPVEAEACYVAVHWTRTEGIRKHPSWFVGIREPRTLPQNIQEWYWLSGRHECGKPCRSREYELPSQLIVHRYRDDQGAAPAVPGETAECYDAAPGETCYAASEWARTVGMQRHPNWYVRVPEPKQLADFQEFFWNARRHDCQPPCRGADPMDLPADDLLDEIGAEDEEKKREQDAFESSVQPELEEQAAEEAARRQQEEEFESSVDPVKEAETALDATPGVAAEPGVATGPAQDPAAGTSTGSGFDWDRAEEHSTNAPTAATVDEGWEEKELLPGPSGAAPREAADATPAAPEAGRGAGSAVEELAPNATGESGEQEPAERENASEEPAEGANMSEEMVRGGARSATMEDTPQACAFYCIFHVSDWGAKCDWSGCGGCERCGAPAPARSGEEPPASAEPEACYDTSEGEPCYRAIQWAMSKGVPQHPEWYREVPAPGGLEDFQEFFWRRGKHACGRPCREAGMAENGTAEAAVEQEAANQSDAGAAKEAGAAEGGGAGGDRNASEEEWLPPDDHVVAEPAVELPAEEQKPADEQESIWTTMQRTGDEQATVADSKFEGSSKLCKAWCAFGLQPWNVKCGLSECAACASCKTLPGEASPDSEEPKQTEEPGAASEQEGRPEAAQVPAEAAVTPLAASEQEAATQGDAAQEQGSAEEPREQKPSEEQRLAEAATQEPAEGQEPAEEQATSADSKSCKMWCMFGLQPWNTKCGLSECSACLRCKSLSGTTSQGSEEPRQPEEQSSAGEQEAPSHNDTNQPPMSEPDVEEALNPAAGAEETQPQVGEAKPAASGSEEPGAAEVTQPIEIDEADIENSLVPSEQEDQSRADEQKPAEKEQSLGAQSSSEAGVQGSAEAVAATPAEEQLDEELAAAAGSKTAGGPRACKMSCKLGLRQWKTKCALTECAGCLRCSGLPGTTSRDPEEAEQAEKQGPSGEQEAADQGDAAQEQGSSQEPQATQGSDAGAAQVSDDAAEAELRPLEDQKSAEPAVQSPAEEQMPLEAQGSGSAEGQEPAEASVEKPAEEQEPTEESVAAAGSKSEGSPAECKMWCMFGLQPWNTKCGLSECSACLRCKDLSGATSQGSEEPRHPEEQSSAGEQEAPSQGDDSNAADAEESLKPAASAEEAQPLKEEAKPEAAKEGPTAADATDTTEDEEDMEKSLAPPEVLATGM